MRPLYLSLFALLVGAAAPAACATNDLTEPANRIERAAAKTAAPRAMEFRVMAAEALQPRHPDLAKTFVDRTIDQIRSAPNLAPSSDVVRALAGLAPREWAALQPRLAAGNRVMVTEALLRAEKPDEALVLFGEALKARELRLGAAAGFLREFSRAKPAEVPRLYREVIASAPFDVKDVTDAQGLLDCARAVAPFDAGLAADAFERVAIAAAAPDFGGTSTPTVSGTFILGGATVNTTGPRDTLLLESAILLRNAAPDRFAKHSAAFARWDLAQAATVRNVRIRVPGPQESALMSIQQRISQMRGLPTDADRARLAIAIAADIHALPPGGAKLGMAQGIGNLSTEGDLGKEALSAVAGVLDEAIHQTDAGANAYMQLASLVRYEHVPAKTQDAALDAADAILALRQKLVEENDFTLTGLDGKSYHLAALRGRVVLLNFWATWCPPCRKEMPDMEKLYQKLESKGLTVLAVSDEERETVAGFLKKQGYTFPILLDPGRKVHEAFGVEGIPKTFLFDRKGKLAAQSIDMRTERQFLEMLKTAGLE